MLYSKPLSKAVGLQLGLAELGLIREVVVL